MRGGKSGGCCRLDDMDESPVILSSFESNYTINERK